MCEDCRAEVVLLLLVWVVVCGETWERVVGDGSDVLLVSWVLALTAEPDHLTHHLGILGVFDQFSNLAG